MTAFRLLVTLAFVDPKKKAEKNDYIRLLATLAFFDPKNRRRQLINVYSLQKEKQIKKEKEVHNCSIWFRFVCVWRLANVVAGRSAGCGTVASTWNLLKFVNFCVRNLNVG
jgi:hypothetical protein